MTELEFSTDDLLDQARGNQTALLHVSVLWATKQPGGVEAWAKFVGDEFAPSWDEIGDGSAIDVARGAAFNFATTADMEPTDLTGDDSRAVLTLTGPQPEWCERWGTTVEEIDRSNEVLYAAIVERRGLSLSTQRDGNTLRWTFSRSG